MSSEVEKILNKTLLILGTVTGVNGFALTDVDIMLGIGLKLTGFISFGFYVVINWDKVRVKFRKWKKK